MLDIGLKISVPCFAHENEKNNTYKKMTFGI